MIVEKRTTVQDRILRNHHVWLVKVFDSDKILHFENEKNESRR